MKSKHNKIELVARPGESEDELEYVRLRGQLFSQTFSFLHKSDPFLQRPYQHKCELQFKHHLPVQTGLHSFQIHNDFVI